MIRQFFVCFYVLTLALCGSLTAAGGLQGDSFDFSAFYETNSVSTEPIYAKLVAEQTSIQPGQSFWLAVEVSLKDGWHTYWKNPGDTGIACSTDWFLPDGFVVDACHLPTPKRYVEGPITYFGYQDHFTVLARLKAPEKLETGKDVTLAATLRWVACDRETCLPGDSDISINLPVTAAEPQLKAESTTLFSEARERLPCDDWTVTAQRMRPGVIELSLLPRGKEGSTIVTADFLPEPNSTVDYHKSPAVVSADDGTYRVVLHESADAIAKANHNELRGLVVLARDQAGERTQQAVAIDVPVIDVSGADFGGSRFDAELGIVLLLAFIGGALLNLMPCVLPVISVKVLQLVKMAGESRRAIFRHGLAFTAGVLVSFWILGGLMLALQSYGRSVGWGFQLQEPLFVGFLAAVLLVFGLSLFGVFEFGAVFASWAGQRESHSKKNHKGGATTAFFAGVLATAVATPCTGPFLGSAVGLAVTLPALASMSIFTAIGLGMSLPYLLLTAYPRLIAWIPRPGMWMVHFKQFMGFLMIGTVLWLVWIFGFQTSTVGVVALLTGLFVVSIGCWIYGSWSTPIQSKRTRVISTVLSVLLLMLGGYIVVTAAGANSDRAVVASHSSDGNRADWTPYSKALFDRLRAEGTPFFVDFTAKWCLICQANKYVLDIDHVRQQFAAVGVVRLVADLTRPDEGLQAELRKHGRSGVPLYLLYSPDAEDPYILPQVLTPDVVSDYLQKIPEASV